MRRLMDDVLKDRIILILVEANERNLNTIDYLESLLIVKEKQLKLLTSLEKRISKLEKRRLNSEN